MIIITLNHFWIFFANALSWVMDQMEEYHTATEVLLVSFCLAEEYHPRQKSEILKPARMAWHKLRQLESSVGLESR